MISSKRGSLRGPEGRSVLTRRFPGPRTERPCWDPPPSPRMGLTLSKLDHSLFYPFCSTKPLPGQWMKRLALSSAQSYFVTPLALLQALCLWPGNNVRCRSRGLASAVLRARRAPLAAAPCVRGPTPLWSVSMSGRAPSRQHLCRLGEAPPRPRRTCTFQGPASPVPWAR